MNDGTHGREVWKSDGSDAGTVIVKDIRTGLREGYPKQLTNVGGTLFFSAVDSTNSRRLWKSDGTDAGTVEVSSLLVGEGSFSPVLANVDGTLFFGADNGERGIGLWKSDGTAAGTTLAPPSSPFN